MRIIKRVNYQVPEIEVTCGKCKSVIAYTSADVTSDPRNDQYVMCPVCGNFIDASPKQNLDFYDR